MEYLLMPVIPLDKLIFLQESYWYYLEFQLNLALSWLIFTLSASIWLFSYRTHLHLTLQACALILLLWFIPGIVMVMTSLRSAKINYKKHRKKMLSLLIGTFYEALNRKA
jgi:hypothetical protein